MPNWPSDCNDYLWIPQIQCRAIIIKGKHLKPLTLMEECRLRVFENRVMRGIFGPKRDKDTGEYRKLHNKELNDLYSSPNIVWMIKSRRMR